MQGTRYRSVGVSLELQAPKPLRPPARDTQIVGKRKPITSKKPRRV
jgi:hypothetical protein